MKIPPIPTTQNITTTSPASTQKPAAASFPSYQQDTFNKTSEKSSKVENPLNKSLVTCTALGVLSRINLNIDLSKLSLDLGNWFKSWRRPPPK
jgi:hypothetical protein